VRLRRRGRDIRQYGGPDRATALACLERLRRRIDREDLLGEVVESDVRFGEFIDSYLAHAECEQTAMSYKGTRNIILNRLLPFFEGLRLREIRPADIESYLCTRRGGKGPTRNRELSTLSGVFRYAQDIGVVRRNPTKDVRRASEPQSPLRLVSASDQQRLIDAVQQPYRLLVLLGLETGMRLGEMLRLEWCDIDFVANTLLVRESKGKGPRVLSMSRTLRSTLEHEARSRTVPLRGPDRVLVGAEIADGDLATRWRRAFKEGAAQKGSSGGGAGWGLLVLLILAGVLVAYENGKPHDEAARTSPSAVSRTLTFKWGGASTGTLNKGRVVQGRLTMPDGVIIEGDWTESRGSIVYPDGRRYEGQWDGSPLEGAPRVGDWWIERPNGEGAMTYPDGRVQRGKWNQGRYVGEPGR
jgi:integrase